MVSYKRQSLSKHCGLVNRAAQLITISSKSHYDSMCLVDGATFGLWDNIKMFQ